jgi:hypothetical protein
VVGAAVQKHISHHLVPEQRPEAFEAEVKTRKIVEWYRFKTDVAEQCTWDMRLDTRLHDCDRRLLYQLNRLHPRETLIYLGEHELHVPCKTPYVPRWGVK